MIHKIDKCKKCKNQPICKYTEVYTAYTTLMVQSLPELESRAVLDTADIPEIGADE